jgi:hypothetical protein
MKLPIVPVCKATKARKGGIVFVSIQYCFNSEERTELGAGIAISPKFYCYSLRQQIIKGFLGIDIMRFPIALWIFINI